MIPGDVSGSSESSGCHYFELGSCVVAGKACSRLSVLPGFSPISLHDLLRATGDGFRSEVLCFLLLGLPMLCSAIWVVMFCLEFGPFFFLLLFPWWRFFLYLFIFK
jgi:hypothetical protein